MILQSSIQRVQRVLRFLGVPGSWSDEISSRRAEVLHTTHVFLFAAGLVYVLLPAWITNGQQEFIYGALLIAVVGQTLLRNGQLEWSGIWTLGTLWVMFAIGPVTEGGILSSSFPGTIVLVIVAGLAYGVRASLAIAVLNLVAGVALLLMKSFGLLPPPRILYSELNVLSDYTFFVLITSILSSVALRRIDRSTRNLESELQRRTVVQEQLLTQNERFRVLTGSALDGYCSIDLNGRFLDVNDSYCRMLGYTREEFLSLVVHDVDARYSEDTIRSQIRDVIRLGHTRFESRHRRKDGREIEVEVSATFMPGARQTVAFVQDITERKRAEEANRLLAHTMESITEIATITDLADHLTFVNQAFLDTYGYRRDEVLGRHIGFLWSPNNPPTLLDEILLQNRSADWKGEVLNVTKDGREFPLYLHTSRVRDRGGKILALVGIAEDITDRKRAEQELRNREEQFRSLYENAAIGIYRTTPEGTILMANAAALRMLGYDSFEELRKRNLEEAGFEPRYSRQSFRDQMERQGMVTGLESSWTRKDGTAIFVRESAKAIRNESGRILYYDGTFEDITEQKMAELALKESEDRLRKAQDMAHVGNWEIDLNLKEVWASEGAFRIYGLERTSPILTIDSIQTVVLPEDRPAMDKALHDLVVHGTPYDQEYRIRRAADGSIRHLNSRAERFLDPQGRPSRIVGVVQDITERTRAAKELRESEQLLRLISENVTDLIGVLDLFGHVVYASPSFRTVFGTSESLVGRRALEIIHPEDRLRVTNLIKEIVRTGVGRSIDCRFQLNGGPVHDVETVASVVKDQHGVVDRIVVVSRDVTEKKQLEQQFLRAQRLESLGTLAGGVAHDLNNVLNPILLAVDSLRKHVTHERGIKVLNMLESSALRGGNIVKQVLGFARGVKGERDAIQVRHLAKDIVAIMKETFPRGITIRTDLANGVWTVVGDPTQIHQVMMNLCVNARDAMPNGGTITVSVQNTVIDRQYAHMHIDAKPGRYVALSIEDTGTGMPPNVLDRIFEPFYTTKESGKGTGLGLSTVHTIVKSHGGFINVYSEVGKGTNFKVYLPADGSGETSEAEQKRTSAALGNGELILVVDDEPLTCEITKQTLEAHGYRAITAADGAEAVARYASQGDEIALVFTDMMMPIMDGPRMTRAIRSLNPKVKIIASSGLHNNGEFVDGESLNIQAFIPKPYNSEKLLETIKRVLTDDAPGNN